MKGCRDNTAGILVKCTDEGHSVVNTLILVLYAKLELLPRGVVVVKGCLALLGP